MLLSRTRNQPTWSDRNQASMLSVLYEMNERMKRNEFPKEEAFPGTHPFLIRQDATYPIIEHNK